LPFPAQAFDRIVCALVVDHVGDLPGFFREMHRVCQPARAVVVSTVHPAMTTLRGVQARFHDPLSGHESRPASCAHHRTAAAVNVMADGYCSSMP
jgi:ubiquinone/menaquinone biosynthesis C-methylase UbiE